MIIFICKHCQFCKWLLSIWLFYVFRVFIIKYVLVFAERDDGRVCVTAVGRRRRGWRIVTRRHGRRRLRHVLHRGRSGRPRRFRVRRGRVLLPAGRGRLVAAALRQPPEHAGHHGRVRAVPVHRPEPVPEHRHVIVLPALGESLLPRYRTILVST